MRYLFAVLLLAGCADTHWDKTGGTTEAFQRDLYECKKDAVAAPSNIDYENMVDECLALRGWRDW